MWVLQAGLGLLDMNPRECEHQHLPLVEAANETLCNVPLKKAWRPVTHVGEMRCPEH